MSKELPQSKQSEEVDLGQLFKLIGKAFDKLFKFIGGIFTGLFKLFINILSHFYKRKVWYAASVVLGILIGFGVDLKSDKAYGANMFIETNFNSARQVYENVKQFQQLAHKDKDVVELSKRLNITEEEASTLKGFYIEPDKDENIIIEKYSDFYNKLDSVSKIEMTYANYKQSLKPYNFKIHQIGVAATDKRIYKKIEKAFLKELCSNSYLEELVEVNHENLEKQDKVLLVQVEKTDSLVKEYLNIRINESNKDAVRGSGTNLYMGNSESASLVVDESKIIEKRLDLEAQRRGINAKRVEEKNVINLLAGFPNTGYDISTWYSKNKIKIPIILFLLTFSVFMIIGLGKFLESQDNK
jgi:chaperonin cofactor prefoldin